jgi:hypothetical protein
VHCLPWKLAVGVRQLGTELYFDAGHDLQHRRRVYRFVKCKTKIYFLCAQDDVP